MFRYFRNVKTPEGERGAVKRVFEDSAEAYLESENYLEVGFVEYKDEMPPEWERFSENGYFVDPVYGELSLDTGERVIEPFKSF